MDFFSWYYHGNGNCIAEDSKLTLEQHDKRFHPDGYKEGDVCTLRDTANKQDLLSPENTKSAIDILKKWLPGVSIVEDENYEALQNSLGHNIREYIKVEDWEHWKWALQQYKDGIMYDCRGVSGKYYLNIPYKKDAQGRETNEQLEPVSRVYYTVLSRIPDVIRKCFYSIGFPKESLDKDAIIRIGRRAIVKSVEKSPEMGDWYSSNRDTQNIYRIYNKQLDEFGEHTHGVGFTEGFENLPFLLDNPIAVIRANTGTKINSTILVVTNVEDEDPEKVFSQNGQVQYADAKHQHKRHQYSVVSLNVDYKSPKFINIGSVYGRSAAEIQQFVKDGMLLYVNRNMAYKVKDQFGGVHFGQKEKKKIGLENISQQNTSQDIIRRMADADDYESALAQPAVHKVINESSFENRSDFGHVMGELALSIHYGEWGDARKIMNRLAASKGYSYDSNLDRYVNKDGHAVSADFEIWDDNGNFEQDFLKRFENGQRPASTRCKILHKGDEPIGWYDRDSGEVHLISGKADPETVAHELGWHASFHYAQKNDPTLYAKMMEYAKTAPEEIKQSVQKIYGKSLTEEELLDEIGARRFTENNLDPLLNEIQRRNARGWFGKVADGVKSVYKGFISRFGRSHFDTNQLIQMSPEDCMAELAKAMVEGKTLTPHSEIVQKTP